MVRSLIVYVYKDNTTDNSVINKPISNNMGYRLLQFMPLIEAMLLIIVCYACDCSFLTVYSYLGIFGFVAIIGSVIFDKKQVKLAIGKDIELDGLAYFLIFVFGVLYIDTYLNKRKKLVPSTTRWPFYLSLLSLLILPFIVL